MSLSNSYNHTATRDQIITRALRIIGAIGQGETPAATAVTEAAESLNDIVKSWAADGMQLWCTREYTLTPVASTTTYTVGVGSTINQPAPSKIIQAFARNTASNKDTPILLITRHEYNMLGNKVQEGSPSQLWYDVPGSISGTEIQGTVYLYVTPDASFASSNTIRFIGVRPLMDFDASSDVLDFPTHWINAVKWGLAAELAFEYGVGLSERQQLVQKADREKALALSYGTEEGHVLIQPVRGWHWETY
jgi:hypothetical protein